MLTLLLTLALQDELVERLFKEGDLETKALAILALRTSESGPLSPKWRAHVRATLADILKDPSSAIRVRALLEIYPRPGATLEPEPIQKALDAVGADPLLKPAASLGFKTPEAPDAKPETFLTDKARDDAYLAILDPATSADERRRLCRIAAATACATTPRWNARDDSAVISSLRWLLGAQNDDGSWGDADVTSLALLAFFGAGYTHLSKDRADGIVYGEIVKSGLKNLMALDPAKLDARGAVLRTLALSEAYGLTGSPLFKEPAQKAVDALAAPEDPELFTWTVLALKSAQLSGFDVNAELLDTVRRRADTMKLVDIEASVKTHAKPVTADAQKSIDEAVRDLGNDDLDVRERATESLRKVGLDAGPALLESRKSADLEVAARSEGLLYSLYLPLNVHPAARAIVCRKLLALAVERDLVVAVMNAPAETRDAEYWYWASLGLFQYDGPAGENWKAFNPGLKEALIRSQNAKRSTPGHGSWDAPTRAGRVRLTTLHTLSLEVYYRYASVFGTR